MYPPLPVGTISFEISEVDFPNAPPELTEVLSLVGDYNIGPLQNIMILPKGFSKSRAIALSGEERKLVFKYAPPFSSPIELDNWIQWTVSLDAALRENQSTVTFAGPVARKDGKFLSEAGGRVYVAYPFLDGESMPFTSLPDDDRRHLISSVGKLLLAGKSLSGLPESSENRFDKARRWAEQLGDPAFGIFPGESLSADYRVFLKGQLEAIERERGQIGYDTLPKGVVQTDLSVKNVFLARGSDGAMSIAGLIDPDMVRLDTADAGLLQFLRKLDHSDEELQNNWSRRRMYEDWSPRLLTSDWVKSAIKQLLNEGAISEQEVLLLPTSYRLFICSVFFFEAAKLDLPQALVSNEFPGIGRRLLAELDAIDWQAEYRGLMPNEPEPVKKEFLLTLGSGLEIDETVECEPIALERIAVVLDELEQTAQELETHEERRIAGLAVQKLQELAKAGKLVQFSAQTRSPQTYAFGFGYADEVGVAKEFFEPGVLSNQLKGTLMTVGTMAAFAEDPTRFQKLFGLYELVPRWDNLKHFMSFFIERVVERKSMLDIVFSNLAMGYQSSQTMAINTFLQERFPEYGVQKRSEQEWATTLQELTPEVALRWYEQHLNAARAFREQGRDFEAEDEYLKAWNTMEVLIEIGNYKSEHIEELKRCFHELQDHIEEAGLPVREPDIVLTVPLYHAEWENGQDLENFLSSLQQELEFFGYARHHRVKVILVDDEPLQFEERYHARLQHTIGDFQSFAKRYGGNVELEYYGAERIQSLLRDMEDRTGVDLSPHIGKEPGLVRNGVAKDMHSFGYAGSFNAAMLVTEAEAAKDALLYPNRQRKYGIHDQDTEFGITGLSKDGRFVYAHTFSFFDRVAEEFMTHPQLEVTSSVLEHNLKYTGMEPTVALKGMASFLEEAAATKPDDVVPPIQNNIPSLWQPPERIYPYPDETAAATYQEMMELFVQAAGNYSRFVFRNLIAVHNGWLIGYDLDTHHDRRPSITKVSVVAGGNQYKRAPRAGVHYPLAGGRFPDRPWGHFECQVAGPGSSSFSSFHPMSHARSMTQTKDSFPTAMAAQLADFGIVQLILSRVPFDLNDRTRSTPESRAAHFLTADLEALSSLENDREFFSDLWNLMRQGMDAEVAESARRIQTVLDSGALKKYGIDDTPFRQVIEPFLKPDFVKDLFEFFYARIREKTPDLQAYFEELINWRRTLTKNLQRSTV